MAFCKFLEFHRIRVQTDNLPSFKNPHRFYIPALVIAVHLGFGYAKVIMARCGVDKPQRLPRLFKDDAHVAHHAYGAIGTGEEHQVAGLGIFQVNLAVHIGKGFRSAGHRYAEMVENISNEARAIETFGRVYRSVFVRHAR